MNEYIEDMDDPIPEQPSAPTPADAPTPAYSPLGTAYDYLPSGERAEETLQQRAATLAASATEETASDSSNTIEYIRFFVGENEHYGIPYPFLEEIIQARQIFTVPCTPAHIAGVTNWRGTLITVLRLHSFFSVEPAESTDAKIIVVRHGAITAGILADQIDVNDRYNPERLAPPMPSQSVSRLEYIKGIYLGKITILDLAFLLSDDNLYVK